MRSPRGRSSVVPYGQSQSPPSRPSAAGGPPFSSVPGAPFSVAGAPALTNSDTAQRSVLPQTPRTSSQYGRGGAPSSTRVNVVLSGERERVNRALLELIAAELPLSAAWPADAAMDRDPVRVALAVARAIARNSTQAAESSLRSEYFLAVRRSAELERQVAVLEAAPPPPPQPPQPARQAPPAPPRKQEGPVVLLGAPSALGAPSVGELAEQAEQVRLAALAQQQDAQLAEARRIAAETERGLAGRRTTTEALRTRVAAQTAALATEEERRAGLERALTEAQSQLDRARETLQNLEAQVAAARALNAERELRVADLEAKRFGLSPATAGAAAAIGTAEQRGATLQARIASLTAELKLQTEGQVRNASGADAKEREAAALQVAVQELETKLHGASQKNVTDTQRLAAAEVRLVGLRTRLATAGSDATAAQESEATLLASIRDSVAAEKKIVDDLKELAGFNAAQEAQNQEQEIEVRELQGRIDARKREFADELKQLKEREAKHDAAELELNAKAQVLEEAVAAHDREIKRFDDLADRSAEQGRLGDEELERLQAQFEAKTREVADATRRAEAARSSVRAIETRRDELKTKVADLQRQTDQALKRAAEQVAQERGLQQQILGLRSDVTAAGYRTNSTDVVVQLSDQLKTCNDTGATMQRRIAELTADNGKLTVASGKLEAEIDRLREQLDRVNAQLAAVQSSIASGGSASQSSAPSGGSISQAQCALAVARGVAQAEHRVTELEEDRERIREETFRIAERTDARHAEALAALQQTLNARAAEYKAAVQKLGDSLAEQKRRTDTLVADQAADVKQIRDLETANRQANTTISALGSQVTALNATIASLKTRLSEAEAENLSHGAELDKARRTCQTTVEAATNESKGLHDDVDKLNGTIHTLRVQETKLKQLVQELRRDNKELHVENERLIDQAGVGTGSP